jgi:hypothetical protein
MGRVFGSFPISTNVEVRRKGPYDARGLVEFLSDLTNISTWIGNDNIAWVYNGMIVTVLEPLYKGIYMLIDEDNYTNINSWQKIEGTAVVVNKFITLGKFIKNDNIYLFTENDNEINYTWVVEGTEYNNNLSTTEETEITVDYSDSGKKRGDMFYVDNSNGIKHREGVEVNITEQIIFPALEPNEILLSYIIVTDSTTGLPAPVDTSLFMRKIRNERTTLSLTNNLINISNQLGGQRHYINFTNNAIIRGMINCFTSSELDIYNEGDMFVIENYSLTDLTIKHNNFTSPIPEITFLFNNNADLIIPYRGLVTFKFDGDSFIVMSSNFSSSSYVHPNHTGDVTSVGDGVQTISNGVVTNNKLANMNANTVKGRLSGNGTPQDISMADLPISTAQATVNNSKVDKEPFPVDASNNINTSSDWNGKTIILNSHPFAATTCTVLGGLNCEGIKNNVGTVNFISGAGRTAVYPNLESELNGIVGSTFSIISIGLTDYIYINNV